MLRLQCALKRNLLIIGLCAGALFAFSSGSLHAQAVAPSSERAVRVLAPNDNNLQGLAFWVAKGPTTSRTRGCRFGYYELSWGFPSPGRSVYTKFKMTF